MRYTPVLVILGLAALAGAGCQEEKTVATTEIRAMLADSVAGEEPIVATLAGGDTLAIDPAVAAFYRERAFQPAWTDHEGLAPAGTDVLEAIGLADTEGLDRERYRFTPARELAGRLAADSVPEERTLAALASLDLLLTEAFIRLAEDLAAGTMDPGQAGLTWEIERGSVDAAQLLASVTAGESPRSVLGAVRPGVPYYDRLIKGLGRLRTVADSGGWAPVPEGEPITEGDEGHRVAALRARLMAGDDPEETRLARAGLDRPQTFDPGLADALRHFQTRHDLHEDGTLGPNTVEALNVPVEDRIEAVRLNLDRWRWLPRELGSRFILVNVAGFELELVDGDTAIESMNVVVGETANRTPIFRDTLEYMVVNPFWNVPSSIANEEILPKARRDPGFLARNDYELLYDGDPVRLTSTTLDDVSSSDIESGRYRIRQRPGASNALGHVKFLFPNDMDIYLHDTPADHLFSQESRAFSHGCIRVERPADLARTLLAALTDRSPSEYDDLRSAGEEQWVTLDEKLPVYILYFTTWVDEDGTIRFHPDIYDLDEALEPERAEELAPLDPADAPGVAG